MSAPTPATPPRSWLALRFFGAVAFGVAGVAAVWQGFGLVGFGTDDHPWRNAATFAPLFVAGFVLLRPGRKWPRRAAVPIGLGLAVVAWWLVPCKEGGMSLRDAVARRDQLRDRLAATGFDDLESGIITKLKIDELRYQYRDLSRPLEDDQKRWVREMNRAITERYQQLPPEDVEAARTLETRVRRFSIQFPDAGSVVSLAVMDWLDRAVKEKSDELHRFHSDWAAFDRSAPGRHALAEAFPEARTRLIVVEEEWVEVSIEPVHPRLVRNEPRERKRADWRAFEKTVLALKSLDTGGDRFTPTRRALFAFAHQDAQSDVAAHLDAGRYEAAFGLARRHAVEWNATATVLGAGELKQLDSLRETCEFFDKLAAKSAKPADSPDVAPPPRTKP